MSALSAAPAPRARASCSRCHRRKKRCDRTLPRCTNCEGAHVACSFQSDDDQNATYPIAFIRRLEARIRDLEGRLAASVSDVAPSDWIAPAGTSQKDISSSAIDGTRELNDDEVTIVAGGAQLQVQEPASRVQQNGNVPTPKSFVDSLKVISLEAAAERHLGSSSGLSFARLTQMVLRRLTPDKAEFVFVTEEDEEEEHQPQNEFASQGLFGDSDATTQNLETAFATGIGMGTMDMDVDNHFTHPSPSFFFGENMQFPLGMNMQSPNFSAPTLFGNITLRDIVDESAETLASLSLPMDSSHVDFLIDFYFAHSHTLYPIVRRSEIMSILTEVRASEVCGTQTCSALQLFKIWIVLAIGSTAYCSVTLDDESESMLYYNKALTYFEAALAYGETAMLEVLTLQVSYSFFNQLGPNTWFLVGTAARIAIGMGLHADSTYQALAVDEAERRKRLFFSIYMMDRVVSVALGRPFAIHDDDIDVSPFAGVDEDNITSTEIRPQPGLQLSLITVPLHILALRRIASKIASQVYSPRASTSLAVKEREAMIHALHEELITWRRNMPFPLPQDSVCFSRVPQLSNSWYDFNYYTHVAMLYRPSPLLPTSSPERLQTLRQMTSMALRTAMTMHQQQRLAYNWLNFLGLYTVSLSLIYSITAQPDNLVSVLQQSRGCEDLECAVNLFDTLAVKFRAAKRVSRMVQDIVQRYRRLCVSAE
ncbi:fungal-specific transcription factor domain-containing protein [Xylariaceae sp. FL1272]|nr:fungal-specific transcription factor domain-containing protein [Xylariaceae sp. FL1272]